MNNSQIAICNPQSLDGILVIDKPAGWTSHDVVARMRKLLKTRRIGHTGTLDPFATGVLVTCIDRATRLVQFLSGDDKEYLATMRLGSATDTGDLTGRKVTPVADARHITTAVLNEALSHFRGRIEQTPPMYSAKKVAGTKLYEMARRGLEIERRPVEVEIKELESIKIFDTSDKDGIQHKDCLIRVVCSAGTYIRTLAEDIGNRLGVGAHLIELRRTRAGNFDLNRAVALEQLVKLVEANEVGRVLVPMVDALNFEIIKLDDEERNAIGHGRSLKRRGDWSNGTQAMLCDQRRQLIAIAVYNGERELWSPQIVLFAE
ncbi:MAG: tRNA pseudouridine(55) synthase TruB [Blastocatellia bacterium]|nr:tRNA pseudouridine(55) synthase TruB [Blastocatellia bacterium]